MESILPEVQPVDRTPWWPNGLPELPSVRTGESDYLTLSRPPERIAPPPELPSVRTGEQDLTPWPPLVSLLYSLAWPSYECELCVSQERGTGCYCSHNDCVTPCVPPGRMDWSLRHESGQVIVATVARALWRVTLGRVAGYPTH